MSTVNLIEDIAYKLPPVIKMRFSKSEILSDVAYCVLRLKKNFDPKKGSLFNYLHKSTVRFLFKKINRANYIAQMEGGQLSLSLSQPPEIEDHLFLNEVNHFE